MRDEVVAQKMLGDGAAVQPEGEIVAAPCDGKITMLYPTLHAFGLVNPDGLEILVHIGIAVSYTHLFPPQILPLY